MNRKNIINNFENNPRYILVLVVWIIFIIVFLSATISTRRVTTQFEYANKSIRFIESCSSALELPKNNFPVSFYIPFGSWPNEKCTLTYARIRFNTDFHWFSIGVFLTLIIDSLLIHQKYFKTVFFVTLPLLYFFTWLLFYWGILKINLGI